MIKSRELYFKATKLLYKSELFFVLVRSYSLSVMYVCSAYEKKLCSCFFKVTIDHLFDNLGKRNYCFGKKSGNSVELILERRIYMHPL